MIVGICDDDQFWCEKAVEIIQKYAEATAKELEVRNFRNCEELFSYGELGEKPFDVILMDIELDAKNKNPETDGIRVAGEINQRWKNCQIVYLTNYLFYATEIHHTKHSFFVLKNQFEKRIGEVFDKVLHELEQSSTKYVFRAKGQVDVSVMAEDIRYFERDKRSTKLVTSWGEYEIWDKISEIEDQLSKLDFVRCHNSYLVYIPAIRELNHETIVMENQKNIPVSRSYRNSVKHAFASWALTQMS